MSSGVAPSTGDTADPFGTATLRSAVLDAWRASPTRFREDANSEEDLALGGYRDRLLVELLQNAADAATRVGEPGRVRVRLVDNELHVANTGAPLDVDGVRALASLRASAKRDGATAGRFGVGFAAVLAVSDEPSVRSAGGGVRFSAFRTREAVEDLPELSEELVRRAGTVPVLRLPFPERSAPAEGYTTEVCLPLRDGARAVVLDAISALDPAVLLALPALTEVDLDGRMIARRADGDDVRIRDGAAERTWRCTRRDGDLSAELLSDRPIEEHGRGTWSVLWAVPVEHGTPRPLDRGQVLHAPTPSDEPLPVPARLIATFPLDPDRRHVAPGALRSWLVRQAAEAYVDLLADLSPADTVLALVPSPSLGGAALEILLRQEILAALGSADWLPAVAGPAVAPGSACALEPQLAGATELLADVLPGLLPAAWAAHRHLRALSALAVRRVGAAEVVESVAAVSRPGTWWRELYAALDDSGVDRESLGALPVPLADGRLVTGARGALLPGPGFPAEVAGVLDLRLVDATAAHPLLERLGAHEATGRAVLEAPATRALVEESFDTPDDPSALAAAVLALVRTAMVRPGELPWLSELALDGADGEVYPAGELLLPGSPLADLMADDAPFGTVADELVQRFGAETLVACGVLDTFSVLDESDVDTADDAYDLDAGEAWLAEVADGRPTVVERLRAVRDLELVRQQAWPQALALLAAEPLRSAVLDRVVVRDSDGTARSVPSYTQWWLRRHRVLGGAAPRTLRLDLAAELDGLYDRAQGTEDELLLAGCLTGLDDVLSDRDGRADLLERLGDPSRSCSPAVLSSIYARLASAARPDDGPLPERVRVGTAEVADARRTVLLDRPWLVPLLGEWDVVPCRAEDQEAVADLLDLALASEVVGGTVGSTTSTALRWADVPGIELAAGRLSTPVPATSVTVHTGLAVGRTPVAWWIDDDGAHVDGSTAALARVLAWQAGRWDRRAAVAEALAAPEGARRQRLEDAAG